MNRRSFIGTFFASLFAPLLPKAEVDQRVPLKVEQHTYKPDENEKLYTDLWTMFSDISEHTKRTGDIILSADNPRVFPPLMGFWAHNPDEPEDLGHGWSISLPDVKKSLDREKALPDPPGYSTTTSAPFSPRLKAELVELQFKSKEGRLRLAMSFPGQRSSVRGKRAAMSFTET